MKGIAIILAACMLLLNLENLVASTQVTVDSEAMECCTDCCSGCCDEESDQHDDKESCNTEKECPPDCDCSHQFQITAITYSFMEFRGTVVHSYQYGHYMNSYSFEYATDFLQPPRFG